MSLDSRSLELPAGALAVMAKNNIPPDIQELLLRGNPRMNVPPGCLAKVIQYVLLNITTKDI